jgi:cytochrome c
MRSFRKLLLLASSVMIFTGEARSEDVRKGEEIYSRCAGCHSLNFDRVGPRHCGLIGRKAGGVEGFEYSEAMKRSGIVWNAKTLDRFLANPTEVVPGTTMTYSGVDDPRERADLIAYLRTASCPGR